MSKKIKNTIYYFLFLQFLIKKPYKPSDLLPMIMKILEVVASQCVIFYFTTIVMFKGIGF